MTTPIDKLIADGLAPITHRDGAHDGNVWQSDNPCAVYANALKVAVSAPNEKMCDAARAFILGLDIQIRTYEDMRKHLARGGNAIPDWMPESGHITKWDVADCIYRLMQEVALAEINRIAEGE